MPEFNIFFNFLMNLEEDNQNSVFPKKAGPAPSLPGLDGGGGTFDHTPKFDGEAESVGLALPPVLGLDGGYGVFGNMPKFNGLALPPVLGRDGGYGAFGNMPEFNFLDEYSRTTGLTLCDLPELEGEVGVVFGSLGSLESGEQEAKPKTSKSTKVIQHIFWGAPAIFFMLLFFFFFFTLIWE
ncbi:hypothetical protein ACE6H2_021432 [Prunus campanulata]